MDRPANIRKLDHTRRKLPFASASAGSAWIREIRKDPSLLELPMQRKDFKAARDYIVLKDLSAFGPMLQTIKMIKTDESTMDLFVAHPWASLDLLISKSERFRVLVLKQLAKAPCTMEQPWNLILYSAFSSQSVLEHHSESPL